MFFCAVICWWIVSIHSSHVLNHLQVNITRTRIQSQLPLSAYLNDIKKDRNLNGSSAYIDQALQIFFNSERSLTWVSLIKRIPRRLITRQTTLYNPIPIYITTSASILSQLRSYRHIIIPLLCKLPCGRLNISFIFNIDSTQNQAHTEATECFSGKLLNWLSFARPTL